MGSKYDEDVRAIALDERIPWDDIDGSRLVITGSTGLLGGLIVASVCERNRLMGVGTQLVLPVRHASTSTVRLDRTGGTVVTWDATSGTVPAVGGCDYVVHLAGVTDSATMIAKPVETIDTTVRGTEAMLELCRATGARMCFASSMEVYGKGSTELLEESCGGELDAMSVRSSYPQSKQLAETLCAAYASQYGVAACVARLAQSFGPGIRVRDHRVFAEIARCCREGRDITLHTDGTKSNMYVYTADAVRALLLLVTRGESGCAYNVANEETFCSVWDMANMVVSQTGEDISVRRAVDPQKARRYAVGGSIRLDTSRLRSLGWNPDYGLDDMYVRMMDDWN